MHGDMRFKTPSVWKYIRRWADNLKAAATAQAKS